jgi:hypothetical protein
MTWKTKYIADNYGRPTKISELGYNQTASLIKREKMRLRTIKSNLQGLYERLYVLKSKEDYTYERRNVYKKIIQTLGIKDEMLKEMEAYQEQEARYKNLLLLALTYLEKGQPVEVIEAILKQAEAET